MCSSSTLSLFFFCFFALCLLFLLVFNKHGRICTTPINMKLGLYCTKDGGEPVHEATQKNKDPGVNPIKHLKGESTVYRLCSTVGISQRFRVFLQSEERTLPIIVYSLVARIIIRRRLYWLFISSPPLFSMTSLNFSYPISLDRKQVIYFSPLI